MHLQNGWTGIDISIPSISYTSSFTNVLTMSYTEGDYVPVLSVAYYTTVMYALN
ncbi:MAG: hypothetical protein N3E37_05075 [Candidatus Micrarchaeota archaeon]|nr:hypothetical protein [Candidatus Micrarchaeota archaeon]